MPSTAAIASKYSGNNDLVHLPATGANEPLGQCSPDDLKTIEAEAETAIAQLLTALRIAPGVHTRETPARVARMFVREVFRGRYEQRPYITTFPNVRSIDQVYTVGPIAIRSACAHHLVPIIGAAWVGLYPNKRLIGLSKFARLAQWVMARPQIQEEATEQLADALWEATQPRGLALVVRARHFCCSWRGVCDDGQMMTTSVMRGSFRNDSTQRAEVLALFNASGASP